jgi:hypothetical protein
MYAFRQKFMKLWVILLEKAGVSEPPLRIPFCELTTLPSCSEKRFPLFPTFNWNKPVLGFWPWKDPYTAIAAFGLIVVCARRGRWQPVPYRLYLETLQEYPSAHIVGQLWLKALLFLIEKNEVLAVKVEGESYLIPTFELAQIALAKDVQLRNV